MNGVSFEEPDAMMCQRRGLTSAAISGFASRRRVSLDTSTMQTKQCVRVGIVGGGAAGVIAAKNLREAGHSVVLFEKAAQLGGVWKYDDATHTDASMYQSLHTNLPTAVMQLDDFPFPPHLPSYVSHTDVLAYIQNYAIHFDVTAVARLQTTVVAITKKTQASDNETASATWQIDVESIDRGVYSETVDKVLICNGHFATPAYAQIPGIEFFKGEMLHSHDYRTAEPFKNKRVLLLGCGPSGQDISLELAKPGGAQQVTVAYREYEANEPSLFERRMLKPSIDRLRPDGTVVFTDGTSQDAPDVLMHCTGYRYIVKHVAPPGILYPELPLPKGEGELDADLREALTEVTAASAAIAPLYKQLFSIAEPDVAFVGLPFRNLPFLCFELQAKWAASVFGGGETSLPSRQHMYASFYEEIRTLPFPMRKLHMLGVDRQKEYFAEIASYSGATVNRDVQEMFSDAGFLRRTYPFHYRQAQFTQDPTRDGQWVRRLTLTDPHGHFTDELVHTFE